MVGSYGNSIFDLRKNCVLYCSIHRAAPFLHSYQQSTKNPAYGFQFLPSPANPSCLFLCLRECRPGGQLEQPLLVLRTVSGTIVPGGAVTLSSFVKNFGTDALPLSCSTEGVAKDNQNNFQLFVVGEPQQAGPVARTEGRSQDQELGSQSPSLQGGERCLSLAISGLIPFKQGFQNNNPESCPFEIFRLCAITSNLITDGERDTLL